MADESSNYWKWQHDANKGRKVPAIKGLSYQERKDLEQALPAGWRIMLATGSQGRKGLIIARLLSRFQTFVAGIFGGMFPALLNEYHPEHTYSSNDDAADTEDARERYGKACFERLVFEGIPKCYDVLFSVGPEGEPPPIWYLKNTIHRDSDYGSAVCMSEAAVTSLYFSLMGYSSQESGAEAARRLGAEFEAEIMREHGAASITGSGTHEGIYQVVPPLGSSQSWESYARQIYSVVESGKAALLSIRGDASKPSSSYEALRHAIDATIRFEGLDTEHGHQEPLIEFLWRSGALYGLHAAISILAGFLKSIPNTKEGIMSPAERQQHAIAALGHGFFAHSIADNSVLCDALAAEGISLDDFMQRYPDGILFGEEGANAMAKLLFAGLIYYAATDSTHSDENDDDDSALRLDYINEQFARFKSMREDWLSVLLFAASAYLATPYFGCVRVCSTMQTSGFYGASMRLPIYAAPDKLFLKSEPHAMPWGSALRKMLPEVLNNVHPSRESEVVALRTILPFMHVKLLRSRMPSATDGAEETEGVIMPLSGDFVEALSTPGLPGETEQMIARMEDVLSHGVLKAAFPDSTPILHHVLQSTLHLVGEAQELEGVMRAIDESIGGYMCRVACPFTELFETIKAGGGFNERCAALFNVPSVLGWDKDDISSLL